MRRLLQLVNRISTWRPGGPALPPPEGAFAPVYDAIEQAVEGTEPNIRLISGYKKRLFEEVSTALAYIDGLVTRIPGPIPMGPDRFAADPLVNALFTNTTELQRNFSASSELREFFDDIWHKDLDQACALLCVSEEKRRRLGTSLSGDMIQREIPQTALNFSDHKVLSPAATVDEVRQALAHCMFDGLITHTLHKLVQMRASQRELEDRRRILQTRLRSRKNQQKGLTPLLMSAYHDDELLNEEEQALMQNPGRRLTPEDCLEELREVLLNPEQMISLRTSIYRITRMGIIVEGDSEEAANDVEVAELEIAGVLQRVVMLVHYPRDAMLPEQRPFAQ